MEHLKYIIVSLILGLIGDRASIYRIKINKYYRVIMFLMYFMDMHNSQLAYIFSKMTHSLTCYLCLKMKVEY